MRTRCERGALATWRRLAWLLKEMSQGEEFTVLARRAAQHKLACGAVGLSTTLLIASGRVAVRYRRDLAELFCHLK